MNRREFLRTAAGGAGGAAVATGTAAGQSGGQPDWGGWLEGIAGGFTDARGQSEVTVKVGASGNGGAFAFAPAGLWVDPGTTVKWEWTGNGGGHNVKHEEGPAALDSGSAVAAPGVNYEFEFTEDHAGITKYFCAPHKSLGMLGAVAVGGDVPTTGGGGGGAPTEPSEMGVPFQAHFVGLATILMMVVSLVYTFFVLKYGESPNASSP
ncbi:MAG: halocyanin domain-containing protein [Halobacteriaceae archaeon]